MKKTIFILLTALSVASAVGAQSPLATQKTEKILALKREANSTISVSGQATISVEADMATLSLAIVQQAKTPLAAREAVTSAADKVIVAIQALGIEKKQIRTGNFSIYPIYDERPGKQNLITGYRGETAISVILEDTALVAGTVDAAVNAGANEIRSLTYGKKDEESLRVATLQQAVANAMKKAAAIAETLGRKLGKALTVEEEGSALRAPDTRAYMAKAMVASSQEAFAPGSIEMSASISVVFEMK
ncbi:MAG: SIMPL domain-containing protein [Rectinemataceae bacterium]|nr:SIMPL domain-containing protein [Rectinemataceae bacterium]